MRYALLTVCVVSVALAGCQEVWPYYEEVLESAKRPRDLTIDVDMPATLTTGQAVPVTLTVTNGTDTDIEIVSPSSAQVFVRLQQQLSAGWGTYRVYPQTTLTVLTPWTLAPGEAQVFILELVAAEDWPTHEPLRMIGEVNGYPLASEPAYFQVSSRPGGRR